MKQVNWNDLFERFLEYLFKTSLKRFLWGLVIVGAALLGLSWIDVVAMIFDVVIEPPQSGKVNAIAQFTGLSLIGVGILSRIALEWWLYSSKQRRLAASLITAACAIAEGFRDQSVSRDAGYFNNEIAICAQAAKDFRKVAPKALVAHKTISSLANPKFEASKKTPYFDVPIADLDVLAGELRNYYGLKKA